MEVQSPRETDRVEYVKEILRSITRRTALVVLQRVEEEFPNLANQNKMDTEEEFRVKEEKPVLGDIMIKEEAIEEADSMLDSVPLESMKRETIDTNIKCKTSGKTQADKRNHITIHSAERRYTCDICYKRFKTSQALQMHSAIHSVHRPKIKCNMCGNNYLNLQSYRRHLTTHGKKNVFTCKICSKSFSDKLYLAKHSVIHKEKKYNCEMCSKSFALRTSLKQHIMYHMGERPYSCNTCNKSFSQRTHLITHIHTHTGYRPHVCKVCGKRFGQTSHLKMHSFLHTEKPLVCDFCGKRFIYRHHLTDHLNSHIGNKPHVCPICSYRCVHRSAMKQHMLNHTGERPHPCLICKKKFKYTEQLKKHLHTH